MTPQERIEKDILRYLEEETLSKPVSDIEKALGIEGLEPIVESLVKAEVIIRRMRYRTKEYFLD